MHSVRFEPPRSVSSVSTSPALHARAIYCPHHVTTHTSAVPCAQVRFSLQKKLPLGSAFKIAGSVPELGSFLPEVNTGPVRVAACIPMSRSISARRAAWISDLR